MRSAELGEEYEMEKYWGREEQIVLNSCSSQVSHCLPVTVSSGRVAY